MRPAKENRSDDNGGPLMSHVSETGEYETAECQLFTYRWDERHDQNGRGKRSAPQQLLERLNTLTHFIADRVQHLNKATNKHRGRMHGDGQQRYHDQC